MSELRPIKRNPLRFDIFDAYVSMGAQSIHRPSALDDFITVARESVSASLENDGFLHGLRTQNMFEYVVVTLGNVRLIKAEDAGGGWFEGDRIAIPDFRVVLHNAEQILVEVKNHHANPVTQPYSMTQSYFESLQHYGGLVGSPVFIAVYWSRMNAWTVVPLEVLRRKGERCVLEIGVALKANRMVSFGDMMIGTTPPLAFHMVADRSKERAFIEDGQVVLTVGGTRIYCAENEITNPTERRIAMLLMMFGIWEEEEPRLEVDADGLPSHIVYQSAPGELTDQGFEMIGELSGIYSRRFILATLESDRVARLGAAITPGEGAVLIPPDYKSETLPLWRFHLEPS